MGNLFHHCSAFNFGYTVTSIKFTGMSQKEIVMAKAFFLLSLPRCQDTNGTLQKDVNLRKFWSVLKRIKQPSFHNVPSLNRATIICALVHCSP